MDISVAIRDTEMGYTAFTVERITYTRSRAGTSSRAVSAPAMGCIHPGTPEMIRLLPEEERSEAFIAVYTDYPLSTGVPEETGGVSFTGADRIHWNGQKWRVVRVRDWAAFGYYQAYAVLLGEDVGDGSSVSHS